MKKLIFISKLFLFPVLLASNEPNFVWRKIYDSGTHDIAIGITSDKLNNIYIAGQTGTDANWDCLTIKYNSSGEIIWVKIYDSGKNDLGYAITVDNDGNVYTVGQTFNGNNYDFLILKYNSMGDLVLQKTFDGGDLDGAYAVAVDNEKNIYIVGQSSVPSKGLYYLILKLDQTGYEFWRTTYPKTNPAFDCYGVAIDNYIDNNSYVYLSGFSLNNFLIIKYNSSTGKPEWIKTFDNGSVELGQNIAIDRNHNLFMTGMAWNTTYSKWNVFTIKVSSAGELLWKKRYDTNNNETGWGIYVDSTSTIYVSGSSNNGKDDDFLLMIYDMNGNLLWRKIYDTGVHNKGYGVTLDTLYNIYIAGYCLNTNYNYDCLIVKYKQYSYPKISVDKTNLNFITSKGVNPPTQTFVISNTGDDESVLNWKADASVSWILLSPSSGTIVKNSSTTITVSVNTTDLSPGNYSATITLSDVTATNSPQIVNINLTIQATVLTKNTNNVSSAELHFGLTSGIRKKVNELKKISGE